jgi:hypothetical protein
MKNVLALIVLALASTAFAAAEKKEVCTDVKDKAGKVVKNKDGSDKQSCKTIKVHKKVDGDKVSDAVKKK